MRILVLASTFPASGKDPIPAFVKDQVINLKKYRPSLELSVLAPHDALSKTKSTTVHPEFTEYRFHYMWPRRLERLAGRGIMPTLKRNPLYHLAIPLIIGAEFMATMRLVGKLKPDLIYAHWFLPQGLVAHWVSLITNVPFVYTSHSSDVQIARKLPVLGPALVRHATKRARQISVVSKRSFDKLRAYFTEDAWQHIGPKVHIIPMGTYPPKLKATKRKPGKRILFVGRLAEKKGVQYLLPAFKRVLKSSPKATLTVAGDGPWRQRLEQIANSLNLPAGSVTFTGHVTAQQRTSLLANHDVFALPSIIAPDGDAEGLPVTLLEALATGKICVATHESGADDILRHGHNGFLAPQKDVLKLARLINESLSLHPTKMQIMQERARQLAASYAWPVIARQHFNSLIDY